jgi:hypothetical protein
MVCSFTDAFNPPHPVAKTLRLQKSSPSTLALYAMEDSGDDAVAAKHTSPKGFSGFATTSIRQRRRQGRKRSIKGERRVKKGGDWQRRRRFNQSSGRGIQQRYLWLRRASTNLLDPAYPKGSLTNGKWHELSSMMLSWSTLLKDVEFEQLLRLASRSSSDVRNIPAIMIEGLLKRILDEKEAGNTGVEVNVDMYEMAIEAWAIVSSATEDQKIALAAANRADDILRSLQDKCVHTGDENLKPTSQSFLTCLGAFANAACPKPTPEASDRSAAAAKCDETLQWMEDLAFEGQNIDAAPSTMAYSLAMDAYAKSGDRDAGAKAEVILRRLISSPAQENTRCYNIVINAFIQGRRGGAIDNAERILAEMEQKYAATSNASIRPDVVSYTSVINGWANARRKSYGAQRAENILNRMQAISDDTTVVANQAVDGIVIAAPVRPNVITYNAVLKAWSRSQDNRAPAKAEAIVRTMESMYKAGNNDAKFDRTTFNTLIHTLSNGGKVETAQRAEDILQRTEILADRGHLEWAPNLYTYNSCIEAWAKVTDPAANSAEHAYRILLRLIAQYEHGDNVRPNSFSYNQVIFALAKSSISDAAVRSEYVLRLMEKAQAEGNSDVQADVFSYSSVISAWSSSGKQGAGRRAEQLLEKMQRLYERGETRLKPNTVTMNSVIDCWAKSGRGTLGARRAESILNRMEKQYKSGDATLKPNALTYNSVLSAWAKSGTKCAHWKAEVLVNKMWDLHKSGNHSNVKPDVFTFNTLVRWSSPGCVITATLVWYERGNMTYECIHSFADSFLFFRIILAHFLFFQD